MLVVVLIYQNWSSTCIPITLFDLKYICFFLKQSRKLYQYEEKIKVKSLCPYFPDIQKSTGKIGTLYISSNWIEMVFIIEEKYEENEA